MFSLPPTNHVVHSGPRETSTTCCPWLGELDAHVLDCRRPEPLGVVDRPSHELAVVVEAVTPHQPDDVRALERLRIGLPDDFGHGPSLVVEGLPSCAS